MNLFESYQTNRVVDRLHSLAQFVLIFLILATVNYIAMLRYKRIDLNEGRPYSLSAESGAYLKKLDKPIDVIVTISERSEDPDLLEILKDVKSLLNEYEYATRTNGANRVKAEYIDVYQETRRAKELGVEKPNAIVFLSGNDKRQVFVNELYSSRSESERDFIAENVFTRSILELSQSIKPKLYFTTNHGEMDLKDFSQSRGLSQFYNELLSRNFDVEPLDLSANDHVPADASLVFVAAPKTRFLPKEQEQLRTYLRRESGRTVLLLEPEVEAGLDDLLYEWGLLADDVILIERDRGSMIDGGDLMVRFFADHPITDELSKFNIPVLTDRSRSVRADPARPIDDSLIVVNLLQSSPNSYGERSYKLSRPTYDADQDLAPPIALGAIAERKVDSSLGISIPGGKAIAFGTASFISNNRIQDAGNLFLALNAINYALDRTAVLNIPPRSIRKAKLNISIEQLLLSRYLIWLGPPLLIGLTGLLVHFARRN